MFASIRKYKTSQGEELTRRVNEGFVPLIREAPGFIAYYALFDGDESWSTISIFESPDQAVKSNETAAEWVEQNVASLVSQGPEICAGDVVAHQEVAGIYD
jgi:hypothetical protein